MMEFQRMKHPPYLTRNEEAWLQTIALDSREIEDMKRTAMGLFLCFVGFILLGLAVILLLDYDLAISPINVIVPAHVFLFAAGERFIRHQAVKTLGPVGVPMTWPSVYAGFILLYIGIWFIIGYYFFPSAYVALPAVLCVSGGFFWMYRAYRRARRRFKENYHEILRILGLPDV